MTTRGTTPTLPFEVDADLTGMSVYLAFRQSGMKPLVKTNDELEIEYDGEVTTITCRLSQRDTLSFHSGGDVEVQVRAVADNGDTAIATNIARFPVLRILQDGELHG